MIQILVNNASDNISLFLSEYDSIFSLRAQIKDRIHLETDNYYLLYCGKVLDDDNQTLFSYGIHNGSTIYVQPRLMGGNLLGMRYLMLALLIVAIISFFILMILGVIPVLANIFYFLIKFTLDYILGIGTWVLSFITQTETAAAQYTAQKGGQSKFNLKATRNKYQQESQAKVEQAGKERAESYNFLTWIYDLFLFVLKHGITGIFVYTVSAILIIPLFFYRTQDRCKSLNLGHYVGLTIAFIYFLFYGVFLNSLDSLINIYFFFSSLLPRFLKFIPDFLLSMIKEGWDETKLAVWYSIPIVGQIIMAYHEAIEAGIIYLKEFLDQEAKYGCDDPQEYQNVQSILASIVYKNKRSPSGGYVENIGRTQPRDNYTTSMAREFINDFKLQSMVELLNIAFNENEIYENKYQDQPFFKRIFNSDYWDWQTSGFAQSMLCTFLKFGGITNAFINDMSGPLSVANMIKTGNIAGIFTSLAYLIIIILAFLLSSMYGISI